MQNETSGMENETLCERVRRAVSLGEEFDEEMRRHLDECGECRTFFKHSQIMSDALASIGAYSYTKDGVSLADSVMMEINRQAMFSKGAPIKKNKAIFRHIGMLAACLAIAVAAIPIVRSSIFSKNNVNMNDENAEISQDASESEAALYSGRSASIAAADGVDNVAYFSVGRTENGMSESAEAGGGEFFAPYSTLQDSTVPYETFEDTETASEAKQFSVDELVWAAYELLFADMEEDDVDIISADVEFPSDGEAKVVFELSDGDILTVPFIENDGVWQILS